MLWWTILIISNAVDINYLFQGLEEFGKIVYKNIAVKVLALILIFTIVKCKTDVWKYISIYCMSIFIGNLSLWVYCRQYIIHISYKELKPLKHFWPSVKLFIPTIASSLYSYLDRTMIGLLATNPDFENGCYEQAEKIVKMATTIVISLGIVMIPRNTNLYSKGKLDELRKNIYFASNYVWAIGLPIMFGIIGISPNAIPWFLGEEFEKSIVIIRILSPIVIFMGFGNVFGLQYMIPAKMDNQWTFCIIIGLVANIITNGIMIPICFSIGASIGTIIAEGTVCILMATRSKKFISLKRILSSSKNYLFASICMYLLIALFEKNLKPTILNTGILAFTGIIIYFLVLIIIKDRFMNKLFLDMKQYIIEKMEKKRNDKEDIKS